MARKRLTPVDPESLPRPAPRPQTPFGPGGLETKSQAPIAHVAADGATHAALRDLSEQVAEARATGRLALSLPLTVVAEDHLTRDRIRFDPEEMAALKASLRAHGQRAPIEVTDLGDGRYGLISGLRRLTALRALHEEAGEARFARVAAVLRQPDSAAEAYVAMVEENEVRADLSYYERARIVARAVEDGVFRDERAALAALFATASRAKRSKIGSFLEIYRTLDGVLAHPAHVPERLGLRLVAALRAGQGPAVSAALRAAEPASPAEEQAVLETALSERPPVPARTPRKPERFELAPGLDLRVERGRQAMTLRLEGRALDGEMMAALLAHLRAFSGDADKA